MTKEMRLAHVEVTTRLALDRRWADAKKQVKLDREHGYDPGYWLDVMFSTAVAYHRLFCGKWSLSTMIRDCEGW